jgi:transposase
MARKPYPSDVTDDEWDFIAPYLTLMKPEAPQRKHDPREVLNAMRWIVRTGSQWRYMPHDLPPWQAVYQQTQRWFAAGVFDAITQDLRRILRILVGRQEEPSAAIFDSRTLQSTPESGDRAGYDGAKRKKGSKVHMAVDTLGYLLSLHVTAANKQDREQVGKLAREVQKQTGKSVELAFVDQGYTGEAPTEAARKQKIELSVVKLPEAKRGFVLLPRRWVVERSFGWLIRFRRLAKDYERLASTLAGMHLAVFAVIMLTRLANWPKSS